MAAMMAPSAAPFFFAYGRDTRRPMRLAITVLIYVAVWALIGFGVDALMNQVMMPASLVFDAAAFGFAILYTLAPWSRHAHARCIEMCGRVSRHGAVADGAMYAACCVACSAGIMVALIVIGMSNVLVIAAGATVMVAYKINGWRELAPAR
jgi:predicted metal-binding membrane protein